MLDLFVYVFFVFKVGHVDYEVELTVTFIYLYTHINNVFYLDFKREDYEKYFVFCCCTCITKLNRKLIL